MAIRFDANTKRLNRNSGLLDYNANYTVMGWVKPLQLTTSLHTKIAIYSSIDDDSDALYRWATSGEWVLKVCAGGAQTEIWSASAVALDQWYCFEIVRTATNALSLYVDGVLIGTNTRQASGRPAPSNIDVGGVLGNIRPAASDIAGYKIWTAALTAAEREVERSVIVPRRTANLYGFWPMFPGAGERARDYSGNARDWSEIGTLTDEHGPPVSWGGAVWLQGLPEAGVSLAPAAAECVAAGEAPGVVRGSLSLAPAESLAIAAGQAPTVEITGGGETVACGAAEAVAGSAAPEVVLGSVVAAPAESWAVAASEAPVVVCGSEEVAPGAAGVMAFGVDPEVVLGSLALGPAAGEATALGSGPEVVYGSLAVAPAESWAVAGSAAPGVDDGRLLAPAAAAITAAGVGPWVICESLSLAPDACSVVVGGLDPDVNIAPVVLTAPVTMAAASVAPVVIGGYWVAVTLGPRGLKLDLGHRPGVREALLLLLEDENGYWLFEDGSPMGYETSLTLPARTFSMTLQEKS